MRMRMQHFVATFSFLRWPFMVLLQCLLNQIKVFARAEEQEPKQQQKRVASVGRWGFTLVFRHFPQPQKPSA